MADFNGNYLTCRAVDEVAATVRTLKAIIEGELGVTLVADLAVSVTIQNSSDTDMTVSHLIDHTTHFITISAGVTRQLVLGGYRLPLSAIYAKVGADNKAFGIEVVFE